MILISFIIMSFIYISVVLTEVCSHWWLASFHTAKLPKIHLILPSIQLLCHDGCTSIATTIKRFCFFIDSGMLFTYIPRTLNTYCLSISYPTHECWWSGSAVPQLSGNPIETSSWCHLCQGLQTQISRGGFHPASIQKEPFPLITLALLLLLRAPSVSSLILYISPGLLVFILRRRSGPGPGWARSRLQWR